jgi:ferredoxin
VKHYGLDFNILRAYVTPREEGLLVLGVTGSAESVESGMEYLADLGVQVQLLSQDITRNEARCTHCGACVSVCPAGALALDPATSKVIFDNAKCIACELCVQACPPRAMEVHF